MSWYGCCKGTYVLLTLLDFLIGAVVTFLGLYPVLAWHGFPILDAVPFLAVGGLLILGAFLSSCGVCVRRHCGCCVTMSTPIVVLICVAEITLGILLFTKVPEKTLNTVKNAVNKDCDTSESGLFADELLEQAGDCDKSHQTTNDLIDRVKDGQKYIAYVMFGLAVLQLIRVYAGRVVRRIDYRRDNPSAQGWQWQNDEDFSSRAEARYRHFSVDDKMGEKYGRRGRGPDAEAPLMGDNEFGSKRGAGRTTDTQILDITPSKCTIM